MKALTPSEIENKLSTLKSWSYLNGTLHKRFNFNNFSENFSFMARVALLAEQLEHHPDWSGGYNTLHISLSTHDSGGVTEKDFQMASSIDQL